MEQRDNKVSVIVPVYNAPKLERSMRSILNQDYDNIELIVVDDGSTDESMRVARDIAAEDARILIVEQPNRGVSNARNTGIKHATGDFICFVDADDWIESSTVSQALSRIRNDQSDCVWFGHRKITGSATGTYGAIGDHAAVISSESQIDEYRKTLLTGRVPGYAVLWLCRTQLVQQTMFDESIHVLEDLLFVCSLLEKRPVVSLLSEPLYNYDLTGSSATRDPHRAQQIAVRSVDGYIRVLEHVLRLEGVKEEERTELLIARDTAAAEFLKYQVIDGRVKLRQLTGVVQKYQAAPSAREAAAILKRRDRRRQLAVDPSKAPVRNALKLWACGSYRRFKLILWRQKTRALFSSTTLG